VITPAVLGTVSASVTTRDTVLVFVPPGETSERAPPPSKVKVPMVNAAEVPLPLATMPPVPAPTVTAPTIPVPSRVPCVTVIVGLTAVVLSCSSVAPLPLMVMPVLVLTEPVPLRVNVPALTSVGH